MLIAGFQIISYAMLASASVYYSNEQVEECDAVKGQGYMTAAMPIGSMAGNLAGGFIYDFAGLHAMLFFTLALVSVGAFIMLLSILKSDKTRLSKSKSLSSME
jgi:PPP family 3-phenylpropionic acid transporter